VPAQIAITQNKGPEPTTKNTDPTAGAEYILSAKPWKVRRRYGVDPLPIASPDWSFAC
jgi:hypothetical protein